MVRERRPRQHPLFLRAFRTYLQFVNSGLYFRKEHIIGLENVPVDGTPVVVVRVLEALITVAKDTEE